ncbi:MAG: 3-oxoacyl-ACP synthase [Desulfobulbaceae bacterium]|jgi:3-oxoacyl-[acyl-carrier-protein] synthase II|nr:3-oxoacyl-ACP synthase [Desulfobulbaceae bacterium]
MTRRVVITAAQAITPIGYGQDAIRRSLMAGQSGVKPLRDDGLLTQHISCQVFGSVDYAIDYQFTRSDKKTMGPVAYYACQVAKDVLADSGLGQEFITSGRLGVAFGSTHGSPTVQRDIYRTFFQDLDKGFKGIGAVDYLRSMVHTTAVNITRMFGITGRVVASSTACTTSAQAIGFGYEAVKYGMQDAMLCGGSDEYDTTTVAVFDNLLACSAAYNHAPSRTPRPFDRARDGLVVGEGGGAVILEEYEAAKRRGAPILAEIVGFACNNNGGDLILPNQDGIAQTLKLALADARLRPEQVDFVSAHATATKMGDIIESQAINAVYGEKPLVTALKSYTGHCMGACGVIETIMTLSMMEAGFIVPTLNLEEVDPRCAALRYAREIIDIKIDVAAIQNFAFGGVNTCLLLRRSESL